ncbi:uncharacterized protein METZ01_LOCUS249604, partial [marine metagenome]
SLVQRQPLRIVPDAKSDVRSVWRLLLGPPDLQYRHPAGSVVQKGATEHDMALLHLCRHQCGHVAGAIHHRDYQSPQRLHALFLGHVLPHLLGLGALRGNHRLLPRRLLSLRASYATDRHARNPNPSPLREKGKV